jgi:hypothetical protein
MCCPYSPFPSWNIDFCRLFFIVIRDNNALRGRWPSLPGASVPAMPSRGYSGNGKQSSLTGGNTSTVAINTINVQTAATDATGIAASIKGAIANSFIAQANPGYA